MHQPYFSRPIDVGYRHGVQICLSFMWLAPASMTPTFTSGFSVRRAVTMSPAVPPICRTTWVSLPKRGPYGRIQVHTADNNVIVSLGYEFINTTQGCVWMPVGGTGITRDIYIAGHCRSAHCGSDKEARKGVTAVTLSLKLPLVLLYYGSIIIRDFIEGRGRSYSRVLNS